MAPLLSSAEGIEFRIDIHKRAVNERCAHQNALGGTSMTKIKIEDLDVDLNELMKKDPKILHKIRGGKYVKQVMLPGPGGWPSGGGSTDDSKLCAGPDTMFCCTGNNSGCAAGADTMFCCTGDNSGCHPFYY
jgi:hypothetical protein